MSDALHQQKSRGERAKALLENPLLTEAFDTVDDALVQIWRDAKTTELREQAHIAVKLLPRIRQAIEAHVKEGELARKKLEEMVKPKRRII